MEVKVDVLLSFGSTRSFLFDTTAPARWYTFSPAEMNAIGPAALEYLGRGELLVSGVAVCERWVWYISKASSGALGFSFDGTAPVPAAVSVANFTELKATAGLQVTYDKNEVVDGDGENSVALFACLVKRKPLFSGEVVDPLKLAPSAIAVKGGDPIGADRISDVLASPALDEVLALVRLSDDPR